MATLKYWVRYQNGDPTSSINWNTFNDTPSILDPQSGSAIIPNNTWIQIADSGIDALSATQSYLEVHAALTTNPTVNASEVLCFSSLSITGSVPATLSLYNGSSANLSASLTGSFSLPEWIYIPTSSYPQSFSGVTFNPTLRNTGSYTYTFQAYNICKNIQSSSVLINVLPPPPPIVNNESLTTYIYTPILYYISASGSPTHYSASNLPSGLYINSSSGLISGSILHSGSYTASLYAYNNNNQGIGSGSLFITAVTGSIAIYFYSGTGESAPPPPVTCSVSVDSGPWVICPLNQVNVYPGNYLPYTGSAIIRASSSLHYKLAVQDGHYTYSSPLLGVNVISAFANQNGLPHEGTNLLKTSSYIKSSGNVSSTADYPYISNYAQYSNPNSNFIYAIPGGGIGLGIASGSFSQTTYFPSSSLFVGSETELYINNVSVYTTTGVVFEGVLFV